MIRWICLQTVIHVWRLQFFYRAPLFDGKLIELQAGQLNKVNGQWVERTGRRNETDAQGRLITANNGPFGGNEREINRTGFFVRKYLDKTPLAGTQGTKSAMWNVYFRISEAYLIAAEGFLGTES